MRTKLKLPKEILSRDGKQRGVCTGGTKPCALTGCTGLRIYVRWPDKKLTYPCSKGMKTINDGLWQIE